MKIRAVGAELFNAGRQTDGQTRHNYRSADKSLARPGSKQAAPVKSVMARGKG